MTISSSFSGMSPHPELQVSCSPAFNLWNLFEGLNLLPGSKRKGMSVVSDVKEMMIEKSKRPRLTCHIGGALTCSTVDNPSKGYDNHLLMGCCFQVGPTSGVSLPPPPWSFSL